MKEQVILAGIIVVAAFGMAIDSWFEDRRNRKLEQEEKTQKALKREKEKNTIVQKEG